MKNKIEKTKHKCSDTKSTPNGLKIKIESLLLERAKQMFRMDGISSLNKHAQSQLAHTADPGPRAPKVSSALGKTSDAGKSTGGASLTKCV